MAVIGARRFFGIPVLITMAMRFERRFRNIDVPDPDAVVKASEAKDLSSS